MTLSFSTKFPNGKPTYFIDKIWVGLFEQEYIGLFGWNYFYKKHMEQFGKPFDALERPTEITGKIHSIREDKSNRWKPGMKIDFVINNRPKNRFQFAPQLEVKSIQKIKIQHLRNVEGEPHFHKMYVFVDGERLSDEAIETLAKNDGFDDGWAFFEYFNEDFSGKIIHWTNHKY